MYIEKGGFAKPKFWADEFMSYGVRNMVSMQGGIGSKEHAGRKRDLGNVYAKSVLLGSGVLSDVAARVLRGMDEVLERIVGEEDNADAEKTGSGVMEVYNFNGAVNADIASSYIYGTDGRTNFVGDVAKRNEYFEHHGTWLKGKHGHAESQKWLEEFGVQLCGPGVSALRDEEKGGADAVVYKQLHARGLRGNDMASETLDHFIAGAEAPRTTLTYLQWELSRNPTRQARLRTELRTLPLDPTTDIPNLKALDALPFLDAVLMETLRLYTPTPGPQHRITPPEGTTIHGIFIPGSTRISASLAILHHNAEVFPEPGVWRPERWGGGDKERESLEEMRKWFWVFSKGSRGCIGKDFTVIVMKLIVAKMYSKYETEVMEDGNMEQEDKFLAGPVGERLVLRFRAVK